jgi:diguanylate cyclase (GGDEF)-like protein
VALSGSSRESIFPFLLEVDASLQLAHIGPLMQRIFPDMRCGARLLDHFELDGVAAEIKNHAALAGYARRSIVMKSRGAEPHVFKGEWFLDDGEQLLCFLGWPWIRDADELSKLGITLHDIPAHNPLGDLLLLLRSSQNTLADTRELAERLRERSNDLKRAYRQLEHIAHFDPLTSLPNRVLLADRLQQAMSQSQRQDRTLAVAYLDLDGFKPINDRHGHAIGDQFLVTLAQRMKEVLREGDTLSRIGGDEFVAVLVDLEETQDCAPILYRLLQTCAAPITAGDFTLSVSASIGVTFFPQDNGDADLLLRHADQAMYQAKQNGKNRYHLFDVAQDNAITTRHESIERIRRALAENEFVLHFQPKVDMQSGRIVGVEALIRWQHPEFGLLPPANFLPVIEGHSLIIDIGEWVIESALSQLDRWNNSGLNLPVSVNIDASQLQRGGFIDQLTVLLARYPGIKHGQLELEILESSALDDVEHVAMLMQQCRELGVNFSLDDFGTGYSSLTYLKRLPAETLKIDRSFVLDMLDDPDDLAIVKGVIGLAAAFRRQVIAEGVETIAHGTRLIALGCSLAQGYCIARPMPADEIPGWVACWRPDRAWTG